MSNSFAISDRWVSQIVGRKTFRIGLTSEFVQRIEIRDSPEQRQWQEILTQPVFLFAKLSPENLEAIKFIEKSGFNLIETNITFRRPIQSNIHFSESSEIRFAVPSDEEQVVEIARNSFRYSRFHMDSHFPKETANHLKGEWARNFFTGTRGQAMVVALFKGRIIGFLQLLKDELGILTIDLIGVDESFRGKGYAGQMIRYAEISCEGISEYRVGTQLVNIPSIRLYQKLGFKLHSGSYVFHFHGQS